jgi:hypothetical protein
VADPTLLSGDSVSPHVIRCAECHELVPADRVRYREERARVAATPRPGQWRAGGPPIFRPTARGPRVAPSTRAAPPLRHASAIERIPVCVDCLQRQRMGLYAVCGIAAACFALAVALYSQVEGRVGNSQVATRSPAEAAASASSRTLSPPLAPTPASLSARPPVAPPVESEGDDASPIWQPAWEAVAGLFASSSAAPAPIWAPVPDHSPSAVIASVSPGEASIVTPTPPATLTPKPIPSDAAAPAAPNAVGATPPAPPAEVTAPASSAPPIWKTERKPTRNKVAKASPNPPGASAVVLRNNGYAALQQRRYRDALIMLRQATMMGDAYAPMYIGQIFEGGIGVPRDVGQASYWYGIAINRGNGAALTAFNRMRVNPY